MTGDWETVRGILLGTDIQDSPNTAPQKGKPLMKPAQGKSWALSELMVDAELDTCDRITLSAVGVVNRTNSIIITVGISGNRIK